MAEERLHKIGTDGKKYYLSPAEEKKVRAGWASDDAERKLYIDTLKYRDDRKKAYPDIGDQLDAILKHLNYMQMDGQTDLIKELDGIVGQWLAVKREFPGPDDT